MLAGSQEALMYDLSVCISNQNYSVFLLFILNTLFYTVKLLSTVFGASYGSAVPFELWCRFYHPNTRDQLMARSLLPLSKLLALITMNSSGDTVSCQSYSLPLLPTEDSDKVIIMSALIRHVIHTTLIAFYDLISKTDTT